MASSATVSVMRRTKKRIYRRRTANSKCRGRTTGCTAKKGCKRTRSGSRKSYCRKASNRHI